MSQLARRADVEGLEEALSPEPGMTTPGAAGRATARRRAAAEGLAALPGEDATIALGRLLLDGDATLRAVALRGLADRDRALATPGMAAAIVAWPEDDAEGRAQAESLLVEGADHQAVLELVEALLVGREDVDRFQALFEALMAEAEPSVLRRCETALLHSLRDRNPVRARTARTVLAWMGGASLPRLEETLAAADAEPERVELIRAVGRTRARAATPVLRRHIDLGSNLERLAAVVALGELSDPRTIDVLMAATDDADPDVRAAAVAAVNALGPVAAIAGVAQSIGTQLAGLEDRVGQVGELAERVVHVAAEPPVAEATAAIASQSGSGLPEGEAPSARPTPAEGQVRPLASLPDDGVSTLGDRLRTRLAAERRLVEQRAAGA